MFLDLGPDPEGDPEIMMILEMCQEIDPKIDVKNVKMKEEKNNVFSGDGYFGFTFCFCWKNLVVAKMNFIQHGSYSFIFTLPIYLYIFII